MVELETRELRYFVAVAEELHFGRAAEHLAIAQPALSKAVRRMELRLGVQLFRRTSRSVALTPAGNALLDHARPALDAVRTAASSARRAGDADAPLRLVIKPGGDANLLSGILAAYAGRSDARRVEIVFGGGADRVHRLRDGRADVALLFAPFDDLRGLAHETLHVEDRVAVLPVDHRLAGRDAVGGDELRDETFPRWTGVAGGGDGPGVADVSQLAHLVALGRTVAVLPRSLVAPASPGIVCVPVADAPPSSIVVARRESDERRDVLAFAAAAASVRRASARMA